MYRFGGQLHIDIGNACKRIRMCSFVQMNECNLCRINWRCIPNWVCGYDKMRFLYTIIAAMAVVIVNSDNDDTDDDNTKLLWTISRRVCGLLTPIMMNIPCGIQCGKTEKCTSPIPSINYASNSPI